jgi:hypothetical protein
MAPEQARDSTKIDQRADIYSLGCTLYVMVTGRPVFTGSNVLEVVTKHASEPVVRPDVYVKGLPLALTDIVLKMLAKKPEDRYASMDEVIKALEDYLGLHGGEKVLESEQYVRTLEQGVRGFLDAGAVQVRTWLLLGFTGACAVLFLLFLRFGWWRTAGGILSLLVMFLVARFVVRGLTQRTHLFLKVRELLLESTWPELAKVAAVIPLFLVGLALVGLLPAWIVATLLAVGFAVALHFTLDRKVAAQRAAPLAKVERMLRTLRLHGLSEEALQEFVCKYSGEHWEEFFEALFGYEAKLAARLRYGMGPKGARPKFAAWRDPIIRWIDRYQRARREAREHKHLQKIEQNNFEAQGLDAAAAREKADRVAEALVQKAAEIKQEAAAAPPPPVLDRTVPPEQGSLDHQVTQAARRFSPPKRVNVQEIFQVADESEQRAPARRSRLVPYLAGSFLGGSVRFMLGASLLLICLLWMHTRHLLPGASDLDEAETYTSVWERAREAEPLHVPLVPEVVLRAFASINPGVAGVLLLLSAVWRSWKIGFVQLLAAATMVIGPVAGVPEVGPLTPQVVCLAVGGALSLVGFLFGRDT